MRKNAFCSLLLSVLSAVCALGQSGPLNLDFETVETTGAPSVWKVSDPLGRPMQGYSARRTKEGAKQGSYCAELSAEPEARRFGNLMQAFDGSGLRGKRIRFRAALRTAGQQNGRAHLWLRVDRQNGEIGFFNNMEDRPVREAEWKYYDILADIDPDAERINLGVILIGAGKLWIDDASFEVLGDTPRLPNEGPRPLSARGLRNELAFARLYGLIRYFHPSDEAARADWVEMALRGVREVESAASDRELARRLRKLFVPIAPTLRVLPAGARYVLPTELRAKPSAKVTYWKHRGVATNHASQIYGSERVEITGAQADGKSVPSPSAPWRADLGGVTAWIPLALYRDAEGTLPRATAPAQQQPPESRPLLSGDDRTVRLADVVIAWNVFQHFYPYVDVTPTDWPAVLRDSLRAASTDRDGDAFTGTLSRMVVQLHDGHGGVYHGGAGAALPLEWDWIEGKLVVTAVAPALAGKLAPGDAVLRIGGRPVAQALAAKEELVSGATAGWIRWVALSELRRGTKGKSVDLEVESFDGSTRVLTVSHEAGAGVEEKRPANLSELESGIFYVDINRTTDAAFQAALPQLERASGIVFDFRGYPIGSKFLTHLAAHKMTSAQWHVPLVVWPDRREMRFEREEGWDLAPASPLLRAKRAFVIDGRAISYAESCMGIVEAYHLGAIVGERTAGTNGNVNPFTLPGGYTVTWTGMKVLKHDSSRHHGVGIEPAIPVARTRAGVAAGHDEFLERAIRALKE